ncbi:tetratricopeptide repeat protein [Candidatus Terasakiella magnetica]|nr:tetratricopeptide repeat protein [Candidatus Terasakiella magnetica]
MKKIFVSALICAPLLMTGCTTASEPSAKPLTPGASSFSDYLVGQYAVRHRQMRDAADFLSSVKSSEDLPTTLDNNLDRQLFTILAGEGRISEAAQIAKRLKQDNLMSHVLLIVDHVAQGQMKSAYELAETLSSKGLGAYVKPLVHAWLIAGEKGVDAALKSMDGFKEQKGLEALYHLHSGLLNQYGERFEEAEKHYKLASVGPNGMSLRLAELYGTLLVKQNRLAEAEKVYQDYSLAHPDSLYIQAMRDELESGVLATRTELSIKDGIAETLFGLSSSLRSHSTRQAGLIMGRLALHIKADFPIAQILVAEILETDGRFLDANAVYNTIPKTNPFSWSARLRMALNLDDISRSDEAIDVLEEMVAQHPERLEGLMTLGDVLRHRDHFDKAQAVYAQAIDLIGQGIGRHHWNLFYSRAITLERLKRWDEAEPLFLKALELEPNQPFVLNYLGYSWIEIGRNMDKAQKMIEEAVAQRPRDGYIVDSLGWVLYRIGEYEKAVVHLERAVELQASDPVINDHLGDAYWKVGRNREARFQWYRARSLNPEKDVLEKIEEKIKNGLIEE